MVEKPEYLAVINPVPALSEAVQREMLAEFQPQEWFVVGKDGTLDQLVSLVRPPRVVLVAYTALLGEQSGSRDDRYDSMVATKVAIHKRHSYAQEAGGRRSNRDWRLMRPAGKGMCGRFAQGRKSALNAKRGAKRWDDKPGMTPQIKAAMKDEWFVIPGKRTVDDAVAAIKKKFRKLASGRTVLYREFGDPVMKKR